MRINKRFITACTALTAFVLLLFTAGCTDVEPTPAGPDGQTSRIHNNNNADELSSRVHLAADSTVAPLNGVVNDAPGGIGRKRSGGYVSSPADNVVLMLRAEIDPPQHNDLALRATHIEITDGFAFVSYNLEGRPYLGGVEVFDVSNISRPRIVSQALFDETDVSAVAYADQRLYLATATGDEGFETPATLEEILLQGEQLTDSARRVDVPSYVATGVCVVDGRVYVTSGAAAEAEGGLTILNQRTLAVESSETFDDARDVDYNADKVVVMQGTPGRLRVYNRHTGEFEAGYEPGGATIPESKSTIEVADDRVYMAAGDQGMKVVSLDNGEILEQFPRVEVEGIDPSLTVTNAVTVNEDLVLMANGEAGLYVAAEGDEGLDLIGFMSFNRTSANYVKAQDNLIFLASGAGGLKIIEAVYYDPADAEFLTLGGWDQLGVPLYLEIPGDDIEDELMQSIEEVFPERQDLTRSRPDFFAEDARKNAVLNEEAEVYVTFVYEGAGWTNTLGFYTYEEDSEPESPEDLDDMTVIFPNVSYDGGGGGLAEGDKVKLRLGTFPAGTIIGYFFIAQGWVGRRGGRITLGLYTHYTNIEFNSEAGEGNEQQHVLAADTDRNLLVLGFEDTRRDSWLCDLDFNEAIFLISADPPEALDMEDVPGLVE